MSHFPLLFPMPLSITFQKHSQGQQKRTTLIKVHKKEGKIVRFAGTLRIQSNVTGMQLIIGGNFKFSTKTSRGVLLDSEF